MRREIIGVYPLCNTASVNIYEIEDDVVLVGINNEELEECGIRYDYVNEDIEDNDDDIILPYFKLGEMEIFLNECMRV